MMFGDLPIIPPRPDELCYPRIGMTFKGEMRFNLESNAWMAHGYGCCLIGRREIWGTHFGVVEGHSTSIETRGWCLSYAYNEQMALEALEITLFDETGKGRVLERYFYSTTSTTEEFIYERNIAENLFQHDSIQSSLGKAFLVTTPMRRTGENTWYDGLATLYRFSEETASFFHGQMERNVKTGMGFDFIQNADRGMFYQGGFLVDAKSGPGVVIGYNHEQHPLVLVKGSWRKDKLNGMVKLYFADRIVSMVCENNAQTEVGKVIFRDSKDTGWSQIDDKTVGKTIDHYIRLNSARNITCWIENTQFNHLDFFKVLIEKKLFLLLSTYLTYFSKAQLVTLAQQLHAMGQAWGCYVCFGQTAMDPTMNLSVYRDEKIDPRAMVLFKSCCKTVLKDLKGYPVFEFMRFLRWLSEVMDSSRVDDELIEGAASYLPRIEVAVGKKNRNFWSFFQAAVYKMTVVWVVERWEEIYRFRPGILLDLPQLLVVKAEIEQRVALRLEQEYLEKQKRLPQLVDEEKALRGQYEAFYTQEMRALKGQLERGQIKITQRLAGDRLAQQGVIDEETKKRREWICEFFYNPVVVKAHERLRRERVLFEEQTLPGILLHLTELPRLIWMRFMALPLEKILHVYQHLVLSQLTQSEYVFDPGLKLCSDDEAFLKREAVLFIQGYMHRHILLTRERIVQVMPSGIDGITDRDNLFYGMVTHGLRDRCIPFKEEQPFQMSSLGLAFAESMAVYDGASQLQWDTLEAGVLPALSRLFNRPEPVAQHEMRP